MRLPWCSWAWSASWLAAGPMGNQTLEGKERKMRISGLLTIVAVVLLLIWVL